MLSTDVSDPLLVGLYCCAPEDYRVFTANANEIYRSFPGRSTVSIAVFVAF